MMTTTTTSITKPCSICLKDKPLSEYHVSAVGYSRGCTLCVHSPSVNKTKEYEGAVFMSNKRGFQQ